MEKTQSSWSPEMEVALIGVSFLRKTSSKMAAHFVNEDPYQGEFITITFARCVENHIGNKKHGSMAAKGLSQERLKEWHEKLALSSQLVDLKKAAGFEEQKEVPNASVLVFDKFLEELGIDKVVLFLELKSLDWDKFCFNGRTKKVNKKLARHNLCVLDEAIEPDYETGQGRVINFASLPLLSKVRQALGELFGEELKLLFAEGNYYFVGKYDYEKGQYDRRGELKTGIGFHGDVERRIVVGLRLGAEHAIHFQCFHQAEAVGQRVVIPLPAGSLYMMSEEAVGRKWKSPSLFVFRHATGHSNYTSTKAEKALKKVAKPDKVAKPTKASSNVQKTLNKRKEVEEQQHLMPWQEQDHELKKRKMD